MKVEVLYVDGCLNWRDTLEDVAATLNEYDVSAKVELVKVRTREEADSLAFLGSPTVRIDGTDVEPDIPDLGYGMEIRVYSVYEEEEAMGGEGGSLGRPPREWIAAAIEAALE